MEKQLVGSCSECGKMVYCDGGFLDGVVLPDHTIKCYACDNQESNLDDSSQSKNE